MRLRHFEWRQPLNTYERGDARNGERGKRRRPGALRVWASRVGIRVVVPGVLVACVVMVGGAGIAQDDAHPAIKRSKHEARRHERAQEKHGQHQRRRPMARASVPQPMSPASHSVSNMPHDTLGIKGRITQVAGSRGPQSPGG